MMRVFCADDRCSLIVGGSHITDYTEPAHADYCTILINSAPGVTCDSPLDGFINVGKPGDTGQKIDKKCQKLPFWDTNLLDGFDTCGCDVLQL